MTAGEPCDVNLEGTTVPVLRDLTAPTLAERELARPRRSEPARTETNPVELEAAAQAYAEAWSEGATAWDRAVAAVVAAVAVRDDQWRARLTERADSLTRDMDDAQRRFARDELRRLIAESEADDA